MSGGGSAECVDRHGDDIATSPDWIVEVLMRIPFLGRRSEVYRTAEALVPVRKVLEDTARALAERSRRSLNLRLPPAVGAAAGTVAGGAAGFAGMTVGAASGASGAAAMTSGLAAAGSLIGGGMLAGMAVIAAPAVVLGVAGYAAVANHNHKKLVVQKQAILQEALRKQAAVQERLRADLDSREADVAHLQALSARLAEIIENLRGDLGQAA
jgi:hypothetical protein